MPPPRKAAGVVLRERLNHLIHTQYIRQDYDACMATIEQQLKECRGVAEYPIYVKALIKRQRGEINESLSLFQAATCLNPHNLANLKQVGRSLYLLARHKAALDVYEEALQISADDWEIWHNKGLCNMYLKEYEASIECFKKANSLQRHGDDEPGVDKAEVVGLGRLQQHEVERQALEFLAAEVHLVVAGHDLRGLGVVLGLPGVHRALDLAHDDAGDLDQPIAELVDAAANAACRLSSHVGSVFHRPGGPLVSRHG